VGFGLGTFRGEQLLRNVTEVVPIGISCLTSTIDFHVAFHKKEEDEIYDFR